MTDREKLIEILQYGMDKYFLLKFEAEIFADLLIANGVRLETKQAISDKTSDSKWISAKDKLPPDVQRVLVHTTRGCQFVATYCHLYNHWQCAKNIHITHWMPLPQPPREE